MPFERPATVNEPSDKFPAQSFAVRDGSKTLDFDLSALAIDGSWTFPVPAAGDAAKVLFGDGTWQSIPGGGDMLGANNLSDLANAGTARTNLGLGSLATLSTVGTAQITDSAVTDAKISAVAATKITGTIATAQIANSAVTDAKISAVATSKLTGTIATAQIADTAVTDAKISAVAASKLTGSIAPARVGVTMDKTLPYNNAGTLAGSNIFLDGIGGRSLWIAQDDFSSFFRLGSNLNTYVHLCNYGNNIIRTLGGGNALFINDNNDAITYIATGTGNTTLGNTTGTTTIYGSTLTIQGTTLKINVGSDAAGDIYYRDASGNFVRLPKGTDGQVLTLASGLPSWAAAGSGGKETIARAKEGNETVISSTTLQNDDDFVFPLKANKKYVISGDLRLSAIASSGFKAAWSLPSGASGRFSIVEDSLGGIVSNADAATGGGQSAAISVSNVTVIYGYILTSSTAGDAIFQWAQNVAHASNTTLNQTSTMTLTEV